MYGITSTIQSNMVMNKGLLELGGYAIPSVIMSNNKVEAREKAERSAALFGISFLAPFALLPVFNKFFLKHNKITEQFLSQHDKIMHLSKKYLTKDGAYLKEGINELLNSKKISHHKNYNEIHSAFQKMLNKFPDTEILRKKLIKTHSQVFMSDFISSALMMGAIYWGSNFLTKKKTGKEGFSAKFEMEDDKALREKAKKHEKDKLKKIATAITLIFGSGIGIAATLKKGMLTQKPGKFTNFVKKHAAKFDYTDGVFMSRLTLLGIMLFGDVPNTLLASRDKEELKYNTLKNTALLATFFGGDLVLNNVAARVIDATLGTKLIDDSKVKQKNTLWNKINSPLRTFKDIELNKIGLSEKILKKTKTAGVAMFWGNFAVLCAILGFGLPYLLNKILRQDVAKDKTSGQSAKQA